MNQTIRHISKIMQIAQIWLFACFMVLLSGNINAQGGPFPPPQQIQVYPVQGLSFGDFYPAATGGTITVDALGSRSANGVVLAGGLYQAALFEVSLLPGRLVSISLPAAPITLIGSNGGSIQLTVGPTDRGNSFVTSGGHPFRNEVYIGGTLTVGSATANPPGNYSGEFSVTFNQN